MGTSSKCFHSAFLSRLFLHWQTRTITGDWYPTNRLFNLKKLKFLLSANNRMELYPLEFVTIMNASDCAAKSTRRNEKKSLRQHTHRAMPDRCVHTEFIQRDSHAVTAIDIFSFSPCLGQASCVGASLHHASCWLHAQFHGAFQLSRNTAAGVGARFRLGIEKNHVSETFSTTYVQSHGYKAEKKVLQPTLHRRDGWGFKTTQLTHGCNEDGREKL